MALVRDPDTPVEQIAALIVDDSASEPVLPGLAALLGHYRGSVDEVVAVADAMRAREADRDEPSLAVLTFGADAAHLADDHAQARRLMDQALARVDDPELLLRLASHLRFIGRTADAVDILAAHVAHPAYGAAAAGIHQGALADARRHLDGEEPLGACRCGSGVDWSDCCRMREAAAIERFLDRSELHALWTAIAGYLPGSAYEGAVGKHVAEWLDLGDPDPWEPGDPEPLAQLAIEHAWIAAGADEDRDDDEDNVLSALAADPGTPPQIAAAARAWRDRVRYGLWQVADPHPAPGLWFTELLTGQELYVACAVEQTERLPRWGVLLGAMVPLDGAWRATGALIQLSPSEADALCETIQAGVEVVAGEIAGRRPGRRAGERLRRPSPFGPAEPHNVYAYEQDPASPEAAALIGRLIGAMLPRLVAELQDARATPPALANTDGEPLSLITARVAVQDASDVAARLAVHPDFEADPEDEGRWSWLGREVPAAQRAAMLAEARAQLRAEGHADSDLLELDGPNRWVRGQLRLRENELTVEVNSQHRLEGLLAILDGFGTAATVVDQTRVDPAQDLPWPAGHRPLGGGLAAPEEGWARQWLDEPVPALRGRTPRQAAGAAERPLLEGLLRQFEYDADLLAQPGQRDEETNWLRDRLGMPADPWA